MDEAIKSFLAMLDKYGLERNGEGEKISQTFPAYIKKYRVGTGFSVKNIEIFTYEIAMSINEGVYGRPMVFTDGEKVMEKFKELSLWKYDPELLLLFVKPSFRSIYSGFKLDVQVNFRNLFFGSFCEDLYENDQLFERFLESSNEKKYRFKKLFANKKAVDELVEEIKKNAREVLTEIDGIDIGYQFSKDFSEVVEVIYNAKLKQEKVKRN